jgi:tRNA A-37 threonylcarbamoyl transferase component Bud32
VSKHYKIIKSGAASILYDDSIIAEPDERLFETDYHTNQQSRQNISDQGGIGRAKVVYFSYQGKALVLKHYYRGGLVASFLKDQYMGFDVENTRSFKEWRLLKQLREFDLPVPEAVAARAVKGPAYFRADLITEEIKDARTLADILSTEPLPAASWQQAGACIKRFHAHDVYHADLNARNILLTGEGQIYLIDFDNSYIRSGSASWKDDNLARLHRSLMKFKKNTPAFNFEEADWSSLLEGYQR